MLKDFSLEGRRALCIGAGRGIGKGIAVTLAEAGADVGIASLNGANAQAVAALAEGHGRPRPAARSPYTKPSISQAACSGTASPIFACPMR